MEVESSSLQNFGADTGQPKPPNPPKPQSLPTFSTFGAETRQPNAEAPRSPRSRRAFGRSRICVQRLRSKDCSENRCCLRYSRRHFPRFLFTPCMDMHKSTLVHTYISATALRAQGVTSSQPPPPNSPLPPSPHVSHPHNSHTTIPQTIGL